MRYLRILSKKDFETQLSHDLEYQAMSEQLAALVVDEKKCRSTVYSAGARSKEYSELTRSLQKFDDKLSKARQVYQDLLDQRKNMVDEVNSNKKELHDAAQDDIREYSRQALHLQRKIHELEKRIATHKNKVYSEICDGITKRKITQHRQDS